MTTIGFSALLKLICLNAQPQMSALRSRYSGSTGGYDYHRSLRQYAHRLLVDREPLADLVSAAQAIARDSERRSVINGLEWLAAWRNANPGTIFHVPPVTFESPSSVFRVQYEPNFGIEINGSRVAVHIFNTATPPLVARLVYSALRMMRPEYEDVFAIDDIAVLSIPDRSLYRLSEAPALAAPDRLVPSLERLLEDAQDQATGNRPIQVPPRGPTPL